MSIVLYIHIPSSSLKYFVSHFKYWGQVWGLYCDHILHRINRNSQGFRFRLGQMQKLLRLWESCLKSRFFRVSNLNDILIELMSFWLRESPKRKQHRRYVYSSLFSCTSCSSSLGHITSSSPLLFSVSFWQRPPHT